MNVKREVIVKPEPVSAVKAEILKELLADGRKTDNEVAKIGQTKGMSKRCHDLGTL